MTAPLTIIGLGPAGLDRLSAVALAALQDPARTVILRTLLHPASAELEALRAVTGCDDLYDSCSDFEDVYEAIADRVIASASNTSTVYAVPGSAVVGERAVAKIVIRHEAI